MSPYPQPSERPDPRGSLDRDVERYKRRERSGAAFWRSLSLLGTIGWSIVLPTVAGAWLGHHVDVRYGTGVRFTLILLTAGVWVGSAIAWRALRRHRE